MSGPRWFDKGKKKDGGANKPTEETFIDALIAHGGYCPCKEPSMHVCLFIICSIFIVLIMGN